jgi:GNAT superfamily N-acetyltransferase
MGVLEVARGSGAGKFLLNATIEKAKSIGAKRLYLLTNKKCESAIQLYETHGFERDENIMREFGREYSRCNVAMSYHGL